MGYRVDLRSRFCYVVLNYPLHYSCNYSVVKKKPMYSGTLFSYYLPGIEKFQNRVTVPNS